MRTKELALFRPLAPVVAFHGRHGLQAHRYLSSRASHRESDPANRLNEGSLCVGTIARYPSIRNETGWDSDSRRLARWRVCLLATVPKVPSPMGAGQLNH